LRFETPTFAFEPEGFGTTFTGSFVVTLNPFLFEVGLGVAFDDDFADGAGDGTFSPSFTTTLIFWPGLRFSIPTFADAPDGFGLIFNFLLGDGDAAGAADALGDGETLGEADGFGVGFTDGFGVG
jgi:hypothetical protein